MTSARFVAMMLLAGALWPVASVAGPVERRVIIISPQPDDERLNEAHQAVAFWNQTLSDLRLDVRLRETELVMPYSDGRSLENFARLVSQRGGRIPRGAAGPQPPSTLTNLVADVVVLLSRQPLMPFAWPLAGSPGYFVAIRTIERARSGDHKVLRNVIAHELGHTLGLRHNRATSTLMCGPCSSLATEGNTQEWMPLTERDRERLRQLHPAE